MSQHIPPHQHHPTHNHHHHQSQHRPPPSNTHHTTYIHYAVPAPSQMHSTPSAILGQNHGIAPQDTTRQPIQPHSSPVMRSPCHPQHSPHQPPQSQQPQKQVMPGALNTLTNGNTGGPLVATGDWTKDLVHLAKTAELKKHALTLQLQTAHILSAHTTLEHKSKTIQDIREQKNKLDSERVRLLNSLREINEDRDKADLMEASIYKECEDLRRRIEEITDGEYVAAKRDVDRLRQELGQPPLPSLQATLDERKTQYLNERRLNSTTDPSPITIKRTGPDADADLHQLGKRPRGRPKGSKNRSKSGATSEAPPASSS